jgi:putative transposase
VELASSPGYPGILGAKQGMIVRKGFKYRLKPTDEQRQQFARFAGACRFIYNKTLGINESRYISSTPRINYADSTGLLRLWKKSEEYGWLRNIDSQVLQQSLKDLDRAYTNCFAGRTNPPTFRKKFLNDSFRYPQRFKVVNSRVFLPKIGWVSFIKHRPIEGIIKNVTISRRGNHWYVSFQVEIEMDIPIHPSDTSVGVDMGITVFAAISTGEMITPLNSFKRHEDKLAKAQRKLSRMVKGSNRYNRQKAKINQIYQTIANCRHDFTHKLSARLTDEHAFIVLEDLRIKNMSKSAKGTIDQPGRHVAAKVGLNQAILDQGWGMFRMQCEYKATWKGVSYSVYHQ